MVGEWGSGGEDVKLGKETEENLPLVFQQVKAVWILCNHCETITQEKIGNVWTKQLNINKLKLVIQFEFTILSKLYLFIETCIQITRMFIQT